MPLLLMSAGDWPPDQRSNVRLRYLALLDFKEKGVYSSYPSRAEWFSSIWAAWKLRAASPSGCSPAVETSQIPNDQ